MLLYEWMELLILPMQKVEALNLQRMEALNLRNGWGGRST
jgi:hypothetical protein